ncbi:Protein disulfide isomerase-like 5-3 [Acorus gramineus]|uniref:Protein disulfide isomerase-like 5-3 n=1 Tax=Acorus gramineus TaxID=55184 RepID=A0AAV9BQY3_ACOGR|nr:Protein disulfide isomerase-like 5-3 [Acorus gramineus]
MNHSSKQLLICGASCFELAEDFLEDYIRQNQLLLCFPLTIDILKQLGEEKRKVVLTIMDDVSDEKSLKLIRTLKSAASANRDSLFSYVGVKQWEEFADTFDVIKIQNCQDWLSWMEMKSTSW